MRVAIVGSGHGACAMAAALAKRDHEVGLVKLSTAIHTENFQVLRQHNAIRLKGIEGEGEFPLHKISTDVNETIPEAQLVLVYYVSNYHPMVARRLAPHLRAHQVVVLNPGYAGSLLFEKELKALGNTAFPLFAEFETLPYTSRIGPAGTVSITSRNLRHPFAAYPASRAQELVKFFTPVLGTCVPRKHILEVALHNPNLVIHTLGVLMNVTAVEHPAQRFAMYRDGFSSSMWNLVHKLDEEKMDVLERLGAPRITYFEEFRFRTLEDTTIDPLEAFQHYASEAPDGPFSVEHRYITEDVPMGLGLLHSLGKATGVATPICDSLIHLANGFLPQHDFWAEARTLEYIWDGTIDQLLKKLTQ